MGLELFEQLRLRGEGLIPTLGSFEGAVDLAVDEINVREDQFQTDRFNIPLWADLTIHMDDLTVLEAAHETLFNAITNAGAQSANYPFCTIEPNVGMVAVPDERLDVLAKMYDPDKYTPAVIEWRRLVPVRRYRQIRSQQGCIYPGRTFFRKRDAA